MVILYPNPSPVKARPFGLGLEPADAGRYVEPVPSDRSWWAAESDRIELERFHRELEAMAAESLAADQASGLGWLLSRHLAESLVNGSLIGHQP
jgi:hypothetical protein